MRTDSARLLLPTERNRFERFLQVKAAPRPHYSGFQIWPDGRQGVSLNHVKQRGQHGSVLILVALSLLVLIGFAGLALDSGISYLAKAKLASAVDGAALAAGAAVKHGANWSEQQANAEAAARRFFYANYPEGTLGTTATLERVEVVLQRGRITIHVSAMARGEVALMRVLGFRERVVRAAAETGTAAVDLALVVDQSSSIVRDYPLVQAANAQLLDKLSAMSDRLALIFFDSDSRLVLPFRATEHGFDKAAALEHVSAPLFHPTNTNTPAALRDAIEQFRHGITSNPSPTQIIMLFTDGLPLWLGAVNPRQQTFDEANNARDHGITVLAVGFGPHLDADYLKCLSNAADADPSCRQPQRPVGAYCQASDASSLQGCYDQLLSQALKLTH